MDYFEFPEEQPEAVRRITEKYSAIEDVDLYRLCQEFLEELEQVGWTFDYGLEGVPFDLRPAGKAQDQVGTCG